MATKTISLLLPARSLTGEIADAGRGVEDLAAQAMGGRLLLFQRLETRSDGVVRRRRLDRCVADAQARHHHQDDQDAHDVRHDVQEGVVAGGGRLFSCRASHGAVDGWEWGVES